MISCVRVSVDQFSHDQRCLESRDGILHGSIIRATSGKLLSGYGFLRPAYLLLIRTGPGECYGTYESTIRLVLFAHNLFKCPWYVYARLLISTQNSRFSDFVNTVKCIISLVRIIMIIFFRLITTRTDAISTPHSSRFLLYSHSDVDMNG
jgi:hypothetical protein